MLLNTFLNSCIFNYDYKNLKYHSKISLRKQLIKAMAFKRIQLKSQIITRKILYNKYCKDMFNNI